MRLNNIGYFIVLLLLFMVAGGTSFAQIKNSVNEEALKEAKISNLNSAQELCRIISSQFDIPTISYEPVTPPKFWTNGILTELGFSQVSLTNWAAGGSGSVALNSYVNAHANYAKGEMYWDNRGQLSYGFIQSFEDGYRKSDDKIILDSKWGYKAINKWYFSVIFNFKSQFSPGFEYKSDASTMVSKFLSPAYMSLGVGIDYKPGKALSVNLAPFTGNMVIVTDSLLRAKYGNAPDETVRWELGAKMTAHFNKEIFKGLKVTSTLNLFTDYMHNFGNIQVNWDFQATYAFHKYFTAGLRTNLIYDDNVIITRPSGRTGKWVQFKEVASINFAYTFGTFKK